MEFYKPEEDLNYESEHTILYTFQYEDAFAFLYTTMGGNVCGGAVMETGFDCGITAPVDHELNQRHVIFYDDEDEADLPYQEVEELVFYYPNEETINIPIEECTGYLVGIKILEYKAHKEDE
jgi:hypothetical protein